MKKIYLCMLMGLAYFASYAQPTLTAANTNPVIGDSYQMALNSNVAFTNATTGANQTWNYSGLTFGSNMGVTASSAVGGMIPTASLKVSYAGGTTNYFNTTNTEMSQLGIEVAALNMIYSDPEIMVKYPFQMGDTYVDTWKATFTNGTPFIRTGTTTVTAVGYGTLTIPSGTFTDVLLVSFQQTYTDSTFGTEFASYSNNSQMFYKPGYHQPILSLSNLSTTIAGTTTNTPSYFYMNNWAAGLFDSKFETAKVNVYPNPSKGNFTVSFSDAASYNDIAFSLTDMTGKTIITQATKINNAYRIETGHKATGIYQLNIIAEGKKIAGSPVQIISE